MESKGTNNTMMKETSDAQAINYTCVGEREETSTSITTIFRKIHAIYYKIPSV